MSSAVKEALESFVAGRLKAEQLVIAVTTAYYGERGAGSREQLRPLIEVIDRASPGIVELGRVEATPGFELRLGERPFPREYESELRRATAAVLSGAGGGTTGAAAAGAAGAGAPGRAGLLARVWRVIGRVFGG